MITAGPTIGISMDPEMAVGVLYITAVEADHEHLRAILKHPNWQLHAVRSYRDGLDLITKVSVAVVLCEASVPDGDWRLLLEEARKSQRVPSLIVTSRLADERLWAEVLNLGGWDVLAIPFEAGEVLRVLFSAYLSYVQRNASRKGPGIANAFERGSAVATGGG